MAGKAKRERIIEAWISAVLTDGGIERCEDLHISAIDAQWVDCNYWVRGAFECLQIANVVLAERSQRYTLAVAFSLRGGRKRLGINFRTFDAFHKKLEWVPPSLYLFHKGKEPWVKAGSVGDTTTSECFESTGLFGDALPHVSCFYLEFLENVGNAYGRSLFLTK